MKKYFIFGFSFFLWGCEKEIPVADFPVSASEVRQYDHMDDWFNIDLPEAFVKKDVSESDVLRIGPSGSDDVEFFVFVPQWGGEAHFMKAGEGEELVVEMEQKRIIVAQDGSFTREVEIHTREVGWDEHDQLILAVDHAFAIQYVDETMLADFLERYESFKDSLVQFGD